MSFSRAKLQRFNEITSCTPSPAEYNFAQKTRTASVVSVSTTAEKFSDNASIVSNESSCFRTPTLIRKKKVPASTTKSIAIKLFKTNDKEILQEKIVECNNKDIYIKDLTEQIEDLKTQLADLNKQKVELECERSRHENNLNDLKKKQKADLDDMVSTHSSKINYLKAILMQRSSEFSTLKEQYMLMKEEHKAILEELLKNINDMGEQFNVKVTKVYTEEISSREERLKEKQMEINRINEQLRISEKQNAEELENLKRRHQHEISKIELEMLEIITSSERTLEEQKKLHKLRISEIENIKNQELNELKINHSNQMDSIRNQKEHNIKQLEEEYETSRDEVERCAKRQVEKVEAMWKNRLKEQQDEASERLKTYQEESESKVIEIELEKNRRKRHLSELKQELDELKNEPDIKQKYEQLQINYNKEIVDIKSKCQDLELHKTRLEKELAELIGMSRTYQVTLQKTRETVEAISKRLLDSDRDVERLKGQLDVCESRKLTLEAECNTYQSKIEVLIKANTELEEKQEKTMEIYRKELRAVKTELKDKTENYKNLTDEAIKKNGDLLHQKQSQLKETRDRLNQQQKLNIEASDSIKNVNTKILSLEKRNADLKEELHKLTMELKEKKEHIRILSAEKQQFEEQLQNEMGKNEELRRELSKIGERDVGVLKSELVAVQEKCETSQQYSEYYKSKVEEYEKEIEDTKKIYKNYNEQTKKYEELLDRFCIIEDEKSRLEKTLEEYNLLIGPYRQQLEAYECERKLLLLQKSDAEVEAVTMSAKYAEILGHQNQKQKIKHMVDLKEKNRELAKANNSLEAKIRSQAKSIEKLKKELAAHNKTLKKSSVTDKENVNSSCDYTLSPLRDRN